MSGLCQYPAVTDFAGLRRFNAGVTARDGVRLATDLYLPSGAGPHPSVLTRTPYNKNGQPVVEMAERWNRRGYAFVVQDCRGRGDSDGAFTPYLNDGRDGFDTIEWAAAQPWSNGDVATVGGSYGGRIQWYAALERPPHLRAMIVLVSPSDPFVEFPTSGHSLMEVCWFRLVDGRVVQNIGAVDWNEVYKHLPMATMDEAAGFSSRWWREAVEHTSLDDYWKPYRYQHRFAELDLPVLHISGWYDDEQIGTPINFVGMTTQAPTETARRSQRMLMGPWGHRVNATRKLGEVDFGPQALIDLEGHEADWLDSVLGRGAASGKPVRIFVMGVNCWRDEEEWPLARTRWTDYFLHSEGNANSRLGDGRLDLQQPRTAESADSYMYDPARPVPFLTEPESTQIGGPDDYAAIEQRGDVLCYTTDVLSDDMEITGPVRLVLFASSSAVDTDFAAKLVDVHPSGFCQRLCDSIVRARYRNGPQEAVLIEPGVIYEYRIDLWNTSQVFKAGHRIRLDVTSSAFPKFDRNLNTGEPIGSSTRMVTAHNSVWHDPEHPSRLILPAIPEALLSR